MKSPSLPNDSYRIINLIFAGIILGIIAYSIYFGGKRAYPIPSGSRMLTGEESISTGLSRSFSAIVRFDFAQATRYNPYGIRIFLFLTLQLIMRISGYFLATSTQRSQLIRLDIILSVILFLVLFRPFLRAIFS